MFYLSVVSGITLSSNITGRLEAVHRVRFAYSTYWILWIWSGCLFVANWPFLSCCGGRGRERHNSTACVVQGVSFRMGSFHRSYRHAVLSRRQNVDEPLYASIWFVRFLEVRKSPIVIFSFTVALQPTQLRYNVSFAEFIHPQLPIAAGNLCECVID